MTIPVKPDLINVSVFGIMANISQFSLHNYLTNLYLSTKHPNLAAFARHMSIFLGQYHNLISVIDSAPADCD